LRLHLVCTLHGLPVAFALTGTKADEREVLLAMFTAEAVLAAAGLRLLRPARQGEPEPAGTRFFKPLRQVIEPVNDTFKGQLDLERHGGHTPGEVTVRVLQRLLAPDRRHLAQRRH
jgi:hypothetical protein